MIVDPINQKSIMQLSTAVLFKYLFYYSHGYLVFIPIQTRRRNNKAKQMIKPSVFAVNSENEYNMGHLEFGKGFTKLPLEEYFSDCNDAPCWLDDAAPLTFHRKCNSPRCLCGVCSARDPLAFGIGTSSWIKKK